MFTIRRIPKYLLIAVAFSAAAGSKALPVNGQITEWESYRQAAKKLETVRDDNRNEEILKAALSAAERIADDDIRVAISLTELANLYRDRGDYGAAEPMYVRSVAICEKPLRSSNAKEASKLSSLATEFASKGDYEQSMLYVQRSMRARSMAFGIEQFNLATTLEELAKMYIAQERNAEAEQLLRRALAIWENAVGLEHPRLATSLESYAIFLNKINRKAEAEALNQRAEAIRARTTTKSTP